MDDSTIYPELYRMLETVTPLRFDCGRLCGEACCRVESELPGMFLFPGEETMFEGRPGFTVTAADLPGYGPVPLLSCGGQCNRAERPLACRVFPLAPVLLQDTLRVGLDPRGKRVCPLCRDSVAALSKPYADAVLAVFRALAGDARTAGFIHALARHLDEFGKPL